MADSRSNVASLFSNLPTKHACPSARPLVPFLPQAVLGSLLGALCVFCPAAHAQDVLSSYSQDGTVTAGTVSYDYRYTRHSVSTGGRGSRPHVYYSWDPFLDQKTTQTLPLVATQSATSSGTFYGPTYAATARGTVAVTNTPTQAVLTVRYTGATTVTTTLAAHQSVTATVHPGSTFTFTVPADTDVTLSTNGDPGGFVYLTGYGTTLLAMGGTGGPVSLDTPLSPGTYYVTSNLAYVSGIDTQLGTVTHPGKTSTSWGFALTLTPNGDNGGGGGGGGGD